MKIFLCHGTEDKIRIREWNAELKVEGHDVWLDDERLRFGQNVDFTIRAAIHGSHLVLVFLSKHSESKEGYIQKEIQFALDRAAEMPEGEIYIIPVLLEKCTVPDRLAGLYSAEVYSDAGVDRFKKFLKELARHVDAPPLGASQPSHLPVAVVRKPNPGRDWKKAERSPKQPSHPCKLGVREHELLNAAAHEHAKEIRHTFTLWGGNLTAGGRSFLRNADARTKAVWKAALKNLKRLGLIQTKSFMKGSYFVTAAGERVSQALGDFQRWHTNQIALSSSSDGPTQIACHGVVKASPFYHPRNVAADGTLTRRFKWDEALWIEGVDSPAVKNIRREPTKISFVEENSGKRIEYFIRPIESLEPGTMLLAIREGVQEPPVVAGPVSEVVAAVPRPSRKRRSGEKPKVLVVDDEEVIANTLAMILNQSGFEARVAYSAEQALQAARDFQPKMLVVDVIMADVNGIDLGIQIRKLLPKIKMLCFSGQAATADLLDRARRQGYDFQLLAKPVHPQDLLTMLREADEDELDSESNTP